ncbi:MAG: copper oxidase [Phenylobacterium sp.]|uniref:multicopper oxidase family protein n=1 Tax=Phenylobacterium sp. TaxID=1871053 RepID=UPI00261FF805|nr:multicopper oxidase domain-containing protein [Phenylobacterium sp.]MDB5496400.1 copper oxidase [Phenylobacterium sp.]
MSFDRRRLLKLGAATSLGVGLASLAACSRRASSPPAPPAAADHTIRIANTKIELAPGVDISTSTYNGQFPGPLLRFYEGRPVVVDIHNDTARPEQLHWHGQKIPVNVDGSAEEGTPFVPPHGSRRISFTPGPAGLRFYHTHVIAGSDLTAGQYGGQVGPVYIEPKREPGRYDREVFLTLKEFGPSLSQGGDMAMDFLQPAAVDAKLKASGEAAMQASLAKGTPHGYEVGYKHFTINGRMLGHGEPIRVKAGERLLLHVLNGSATEIRSLALPGHSFQVVALDGNPVPTPAEAPVLWIGTAERVSAIVAMNRPGVWVLGDVSDDDRGNGMGVVVEYAGQTGPPKWSKPPASKWDYLRFGRTGAGAQAPDEVFDMTFAKDNAALGGFNRWTINGVAFSDKQMEPMFKLRKGRRYRLRMSNASDDIHPIHLHRHSFELTRIAGRPTAGVLKDVVMLGGYQRMEVDFTADNPGRTLFHCHQQLHMDFGFMCLFDYA